MVKFNSLFAFNGRNFAILLTRKTELKHDEQAANHYFFRSVLYTYERDFQNHLIRSLKCLIAGKELHYEFGIKCISNYKDYE